MRATLLGLAAVGVSTDALARRAELDLTTLDDPEHWIPTAVVRSLWEEAARMDPRRDLGLVAGRSVPAGALDVVDYLLPACSTFGEAFQAIERLHDVATTTSRFRIERGTDAIRVRSELRVPGAGIHPLGRDYVFSLLLNRFRGIDAAMRPRSIFLRGPRLAEADRYAECFGAPVEFDADETVLEYAPETWALPMAHPDAVLRSILERHAHALALAAPRDGWVDHARKELSLMLGQGRAELATLAKRLGTSTRTLQRRLIEEGVPYSALLESARRDLASAHLHEGRLGVDEIAALLGYSEPRAFARAFRRWTGMTPTAARALGRGRDRDGAG